MSGQGNAEQIAIVNCRVDGVKRNPLKTSIYYLVW